MRWQAQQKGKKQKAQHFPPPSAYRVASLGLRWHGGGPAGVIWFSRVVYRIYRAENFQTWGSFQQGFLHLANLQQSHNKAVDFLSNPGFFLLRVPLFCSTKVDQASLQVSLSCRLVAFVSLTRYF